jgi:hypothetical protein
MTQHDGDSLSTVCARTYAHAHDTSEMRGASCCVIEGDVASEGDGYLAEGAQFSSRAPRANGSHSFNGCSSLGTGGKAQRGTQAPESHNFDPINAALGSSAIAAPAAEAGRGKPLKVAI